MQGQHDSARSDVCLLPPCLLSVPSHRRGARLRRRGATPGTRGDRSRRRCQARQRAAHSPPRPRSTDTARDQVSGTARRDGGPAQPQTQRGNRQETEMTPLRGLLHYSLNALVSFTTCPSLCVFATRVSVDCVQTEAVVKVSRNTPERGSGAQRFKPGAFRLKNLLDFTAGTYVPGPSKLATFAVVIQ